MDVNADLEKVREILDECGNQHKSIEVDKVIDVDVGNLVACCFTELDKTQIRDSSKLDEYFKETSRDAIQKLLNEVWQLPTEMIENSKCAKLPQSKYVLPREKRLPKEIPETKWEAFAKSKNIQKKKKGRKVWDDVMQKWVPRYGYEKRLADDQKNWMMEIKPNEDPFIDTYAKAKEEKKERVAKNKYQRLHNIMSSREKSSKQLHEDAHDVRTSTRSMGVFDKKLRNEQPLVEVMSKKKRKLAQNENPNKSLKVENKENMKLLTKINKKEVNLEVAVNKQIARENYVACRKINDVILSKAEKKRQRKKPISTAEHKARLKGTLPDKFKRTPKAVLYEKNRKKRENARAGGGKGKGGGGNKRGQKAGRGRGGGKKGKK